MEYGTVDGIDKPVARIVLGTMIITDELEARPKGPWGDINREQSFALLDDVLAQGGNTFDTAHVYGIGCASERGLGLWMKERGNREEVVIIGKGGIRSSPPAPHKSMPSFIEADIWESLGNLQTNYMDLYLMHYDAPEHPVGPFVETMYGHLEAGRIHAYGGSNWTHERIEEANEYAAKHNMAPFVASEPNYSLAEQVALPTPDRITLQGRKYVDARAWYAANQMPVFSYSSVGEGFMSGRVTRENHREVLSQWSMRVYGHEVNLKRLDRAWALAEERGATVPQIALAFVIDSPLNVFPLVGARSGAEFADSAKSLDIKLTERERAWLDLEIDER